MQEQETMYALYLSWAANGTDTASVNGIPLHSFQLPALFKA